MNRLLENILKHSQKQVLREFDMTKSGSAMARYLGTGFPYKEDNVPITPEPATWIQVQIDDKLCLKKVYELSTVKFLLYFINETINLAEEMHHHPEILIDHTQVTITLYTRDINDVTDRDIDMSKKIDELFEDVNVIKFRG
jgi:4a-hydroxytetrahydrobiopterin dehydratase